MVVQFPGLGIQVTVDRVAFTIGNFEIYWYAVIIATGGILALLYAFRATKFHKVPEDPFIDVLIVGLISGVLGARFYYVITSLDEFGGNVWDMLNFRGGGMAIYGGIIFGVLGGFLVARKKKLNILPMMDIVSISFLIGQGIGRWGNFINQEAFGTNTNLPWGMYSNGTRNFLLSNMARLSEQGVTVDPTLPVHPCFLYESLWCLLGVALLLWYRKHRKFDGEMFLLYIGWYGLIRFFIEGIRTDSLYAFGFRISQAVALLCVVVSIALIILKRRKMKKQCVSVTGTNSPDYEDEYTKRKKEIKKASLEELDMSVFEEDEEIGSSAETKEDESFSDKDTDDIVDSDRGETEKDKSELGTDEE